MLALSDVLAFTVVAYCRFGRPTGSSLRRNFYHSECTVFSYSHIMFSPKI